MAVKKVIKRKVTPIVDESKSVWVDTDSEGSYKEVNKILISDIFGNSFNLEFNDKSIMGEISELPHCCGIYEIGNLGINELFPQEAFNELMNGLCTKGYTLVINTINTTVDNRTWARLLEKCPSFTEVKSFVNPNTRNTIRMWISNG